MALTPIAVLSSMEGSPDNENRLGERSVDETDDDGTAELITSILIKKRLARVHSSIETPSTPVSLLLPACTGTTPAKEMPLTNNRHRLSVDAETWPSTNIGSPMNNNIIQPLSSSRRRPPPQLNRRRSSAMSNRSGDLARGQEILHNVGKALQRTHSRLKNNKLIHIFYFLALPIYTIFGAVLFQWLDGAHDEPIQLQHDRRCIAEKSTIIRAVNIDCANRSFESCHQRVVDVADTIEECYRGWHRNHRDVTHPMSNLFNAAVFAFSVYTTIGYGNMAADTLSSRIATVIYAIFGIPLFFAFVKEEGIFFMQIFLHALHRLKRRCRLRTKWQHKEATVRCWRGAVTKLNCCCRKEVNNNRQQASPLTINRMVSLRRSFIVTECQQQRGAVDSPTKVSIRVSGADQQAEWRGRRWRSGGDKSGRNRQNSTQSQGSAVLNAARHHRLVVVAALSFLSFYLMSVSCSLYFMTDDWTLFDSFYFLFNSVALIGFGDVFPKNPRVVLYNSAFIIIGVVLFSMFYFLLQEQIRRTAFDASNRARQSIHYGQSLLAHKVNKWSRRNSPNMDDHNTNFANLKKRRQSAPAVSTIESRYLSPTNSYVGPST